MQIDKKWSAIFKLLIIAALLIWLLNYANVTFLQVIKDMPRANFVLLVPASICFFVHTLAAYIAWHKSLSLFQVDSGVAETFPLYGFSTLTKYVPGGIWHAGSRVFVLGRMGYSKTKTLLSVIYDSLEGIALCGVLLFLIFPMANTELILSFDSRFLNFLVPTLGLLVLLATLSPFFLKKCLFWYRSAAVGDLQQLKFSQITILQIVLLYTVSLVLFVVANYLCFRAYLPDLASLDADFAFIILLAAFSGLLAIFAPAGLGVRESILYLSFSRIIDDPLLLTICLAPRFVLLVSEVLFFLVSRFFPFSKTQLNFSQYNPQNNPQNNPQDKPQDKLQESSQGASTEL